MTPDTPTPIDWRAAYDLPRFIALRDRRNRFIGLASAAILAWFSVFLLVIGAAPDFAATHVLSGITVGYLLGLSQFVLAWLVTWRYLRLSDRTLSTMERQVHLALADIERRTGSVS